MKIFFPILAVFTVFVFFSCKALPHERTEIPSESTGIPQRSPVIQPESTIIPSENIEFPHERVPEPAAAPVERPEPVDRPEPPVLIMGKGLLPGDSLMKYLLFTNTGADGNFVRTLSNLYVEEAAREGVNHDIAFAQMCLETGFLRYGNLVTPDMNNFCGLGATGIIGPDGFVERGLVFPNPRTGVRAHIQHLKAYATTEPLNFDLVDPRYRYVKLGSSPEIHGLAGTWAADRAYAGKIENILKQMYELSL